ITLSGGSFSFVGNNTASTASTETVGNIVLASSHAFIQSAAGTGTGDTATLTASSLTRNATATVDFSGTNLGTASNRGLFTTAPATVGSNGGILPYGTFANNDFATYSTTNGVTVFTGYVSSIAAAGPTDTVRLLNANETVAASKTINALLINFQGNGTVTVN